MARDPEQSHATRAPSAVRRADWNGLLTAQRATTADVQLKATLKQSSAGGSGAFLGLGDDRQRYWIKPLNNAQGERVPVTEQIVGRAGNLIGAPTCKVRTIAIGDEFAGWEFRQGQALEPGIAHASLNVEDAVFTRALDHRVDDDNSRRHAFVFGLYDWCWGGDVQGLFALRDENRFYSHDHGWYLPPEGPTWTIDELEAQVDMSHELSTNVDGIGASIANEVAAALEAVQRNSIRDALAMIPSNWPVNDDELECAGFFLEKRAPAVAQRIRRRFGRIS